MRARTCLFLSFFLLVLNSLPASDLPEQVTLKKAVVLSLMMDGKSVGSIHVPEGREVILVKQTDAGLEVSVGAATGVVAESDTDFAERMSQLVEDQKQVEPVKEVASDVTGEAENESEQKKQQKTQRIQLEFSAKDRPGAYEIAEFRIWHADDQRAPRGVLVLVPGFNGDGRGMATDLSWQKIAREENFMIVACHFKGGAYHSDVSAGSAEALLDALNHLGEHAGFGDLDDLPLVMWGHSAGGQYNYNFTQWKPEQVLTFVVNKGAYYTKERDKKARKVPALFFIGMKDSDLRIQNITGIFMEGREKDAPWCLIREPHTGHGLGASQRLTQKYFKTIIPIRLPAGEEDLLEVDLETGFTGNLNDFQITEAADAKGDPEEYSWLPTAELMEDWKAIVSR